MPPPPIIVPPPSKPRRGQGWMIFAIILLVLLAFSLFGNFPQFVAHAFTGGSGFTRDTFGNVRDMAPRLDEFYLKNNHASDKIAVIPVDGIISGDSADPSGNTMVDVFKAQLDRAKSDARVKAVILKVNSPGGEVMASDEIGRAIIDFQDKTGKPVICSMGSLAASGAY